MNLAHHLVTLSLRAYQLVVSPVLHTLCGPLSGCRFTPTCSHYAAEAVQVHGLAKGSWLAARRLCRCHPWGACGHDPVPGVSPSPDIFVARPAEAGAEVRCSVVSPLCVPSDPDLCPRGASVS